MDADKLSKLNGLNDTYCQMYGMQGKFDEDKITDMTAAHANAKSGSFMLRHKYACSRLDEVGFWVIETLEELDFDDMCCLVFTLVTIFASAVDRAADILCKPDSASVAFNGEVALWVSAEVFWIDIR